MIKNNDAVNEIRKNREATYKKCNYDLKKYCDYVNKEAEFFKKDEKNSHVHNTKKVAWESFMTFQELIDECQNLKLEELEKLIEILQTMAEKKRRKKTIKWKFWYSYVDTFKVNPFTH